MDCDYYDDIYAGSIEVFVDDEPEYSELLGPDGWPLKCEKLRVGFDLLPKMNRSEDRA
jgi:hypothetical protein